MVSFKALCLLSLLPFSSALSADSAKGNAFNDVPSYSWSVAKKEQPAPASVPELAAVLQGSYFVDMATGQIRCLTVDSVSTTCQPFASGMAISAMPKHGTWLLLIVGLMVSMTVGRRARFLR